MGEAGLSPAPLPGSWRIGALDHSGAELPGVSQHHPGSQLDVRSPRCNRDSGFLILCMTGALVGYIPTVIRIFTAQDAGAADRVKLGTAPW